MKMFNFFRKSWLQSSLWRPNSRRKIYLIAEGQHHHLDKIYQQVNVDYFAGKLDLKITWFTRRRSQTPTRIVLGSYHFKRRLIRINRYLDQSHIPGYFVAYIIYHEMLHEVFPPVCGKRGGRSIHHLQFKEREKQFKEYAQALEFQKKIKHKIFRDRL